MQEKPLFVVNGISPAQITFDNKKKYCISTYLQQWQETAHAKSYRVDTKYKGMISLGKV